MRQTNSRISRQPLRSFWNITIRTAPPTETTCPNSGNQVCGLIAIGLFVYHSWCRETFFDVVADRLCGGATKDVSVLHVPADCFEE